MMSEQYFVRDEYALADYKIYVHTKFQKHISAKSSVFGVQRGRFVFLRYSLTHARCLISITVQPLPTRSCSVPIGLEAVQVPP
jgi:hypothetical protein